MARDESIAHTRQRTIERGRFCAYTLTGIGCTKVSGMSIVSPKPPDKPAFLLSNRFGKSH